MKSSIFSGIVWHQRYKPKMHAFTYPHFLLAIEFAELNELKLNRFLFAYNKFALLSIYDADYLHTGSLSIAEKLRQFLASRGVTEAIDSLQLLTLPKFLGYAFNPVNFYLARTNDKKVVSIVAEVHNTFGDTHLYLMQPQPEQAHSSPLVFKFPKEFFVSPFFAVAGEYQLTFQQTDESLNVEVALEDDGERIFSAGICAKPDALSNRSLLGCLIQYPFCILGAMLRIEFQALQLYFLRNVSVFNPAVAVSQNTIRSRPKLFDSFRLRVVGLMRKFRMVTSS